MDRYLFKLAEERILTALGQNQPQGPPRAIFGGREPQFLDRPQKLGAVGPQRDPRSPFRGFSGNLKISYNEVSRSDTSFRRAEGRDENASFEGDTRPSKEKAAKTAKTAFFARGRKSRFLRFFA